MNVRVRAFFLTALLIVAGSSATRADLPPRNFWVNPTFESGVNLNQTNGTPLNWNAGGGDPTICQVTTNKSVSSRHSLAVIDSGGSYGEWYSDLTFNGQALDAAIHAAKSGIYRVIQE